MSDKIKCGFCKTEVEQDALVCPACGASHYYYAYKGQRKGYLSANEAEDQIKEVTEASPLKYAKYSFIFFALSYVAYKTAGLFEPIWVVFAIIWIVAGFILLPGSILILLVLLWHKQKIYDAPKRFWVQKPIANITHEYTTVYKR